MDSPRHPERVRRVQIPKKEKHMFFIFLKAYLRRMQIEICVYTQPQVHICLAVSSCLPVSVAVLSLFSLLFVLLLVYTGVIRGSSRFSG
jgi:hypothetical protein